MSIHSFCFFSSSFAAKEQNWIKVLVCIAAMQMEEAML
jgi:hypothetical protein